MGGGRALPCSGQGVDNYYQLALLVAGPQLEELLKRNETHPSQPPDARARLALARFIVHSELRYAKHSMSKEAGFD